MRRRTRALTISALGVLIIELGATLGTVFGTPFAPVDGWGPTRPADVLAFVMVVVGCGALMFFSRFPRTAAAIATASYLVFALRDHELGMFLPPMVAIFALAALARHRLAAVVVALASLGASLVWVGHRADSIADPGIALLVWVAFGSVLAAFFVMPLVVGEIVRTRTELRETRSALAPVSTPRPDRRPRESA
ncbi:MAG: hypothetical protein ACTH31_10230 [Pseudoclavibacter sp.]